MLLLKSGGPHVLRATQVNDNIQVGGAADIYLPALNVVTIWRFEVDWISTAPVDLDAHVSCSNAKAS